MIIIVVGLMLATLAGTVLAQVPAVTNPQLRVVHNYVGASPVDVYIAGSLIFGNISYKNVTPYQTIGVGPQVIRVVPNGTGPSNPPVIGNEPAHTFETNADVTLVVAGLDRSENSLAEYWFVEDNITPPVEPGLAKVRLFHAAISTPELGLCVTGTDQCFGAPLGYKNFADVQVIPGTYDVEVQQARTDNVYGNAVLSFEAGAVYSVFMVGTSVPANTDGNRSAQTGVSIVQTIDLPVNPPSVQPAPNPGNPPGAGQPVVPPPTLPPTTGALLSTEAMLVLAGLGLVMGGASWFIWRQRHTG